MSTARVGEWSSRTGKPPQSMRTGTAPPRADGKHAPWLPPCFNTMNERKITVGNVDKIKELKKKLAEAERYAARLETMCKRQDKQLMETQEGALELQRAMDGVLMAATLEHGEAVKNGQTGETVGWRLWIPDIDAGRMAEQYLLHARKDLENGGYVVSVVPRGQG